MAEYRVTWAIEVDADDPEDAARKARAAQTRRGTTATVFEVRGRTRHGWSAPTDIDLGD